jgi:hypothetical protein
VLDDEGWHADGRKDPARPLASRVGT